MCSHKADGQINADIGAGLNYNKELHPAFKISFGYELHKVVTEFVYQPTISKVVNEPTMFIGLKTGYNYKGFVPMVGYYYAHVNADDKSKNKWAGVGYSLKYVYVLGDAGGLFLEGLYLNKSYHLIAGFHITFK